MREKEREREKERASENEIECERDRAREHARERKHDVPCADAPLAAYRMQEATGGRTERGV